MNRKSRRFLDIIIVLTQKDLKVRYKSSLLGYLWSVGHPLAFALVYYVAFKVIVRIPLEDYSLFLICGLFPWQWFANSVNASPTVFLSNAPLIKKVDFPRNLLPFTLVLQDMLHLFFAVPVILLFLLISGKTPSLLWIVGIPFLAAVQFCLVYGVSLMIASLNLFFRDLERLTTIFTTVFFYVTPIFYSETMIPSKFQGLVNLNPMAAVIIGWRSLFLQGTLGWETVLLSLCHGAVFLGLGLYVYNKLVWRFAEVL